MNREVSFLAPSLGDANRPGAFHGRLSGQLALKAALRREVIDG
jgi:hypothetical protein